MQPNCPSCFIFITLRKNNYAEFAKECSQDMIWNGCKANSAIKQTERGLDAALTVAKKNLIEIVY